jgi:hypothetical protein
MKQRNVSLATFGWFIAVGVVCLTVAIVNTIIA